MPSSEASELLTTAVGSFLAAVPDNPKSNILWSVFYIREHAPSGFPNHSTASAVDDTAGNALHSRILQLPDLQPGLALDDDLLRVVRDTWGKITGGNGEGFMQFSEREGIGLEGIGLEGDEEDYDQ